MFRVFILLTSLFLIIATSDFYAQGKSNGKGKSHQKVHVCHNGIMLEINEAALDAHLAHGDELPYLDDNGELVCPCERTQEPDPKLCDDGTYIYPEWNRELCDWVFADCIDCSEPTSAQPPFNLGPPYQWVWNSDICGWVVVDMQTNQIVPCGTRMLFLEILCGCQSADGNYVLCPTE